MIERNGRLAGEFGKKGWLPDQLDAFAHGGSQDNNNVFSVIYNAVYISVTASISLTDP